MSLPILLARRSLATRAAPTFARSLSTSAVLNSPMPTPRRKVDEKGYEHHFKGASTALRASRCAQLTPLSYSDSVAVAPEPAPAAVQPTTAASWQPSRPHEKYLLAYPVYSPAELDAVKVTSFEPKTRADKWARFLVKKARWAFDLVSGYKVRLLSILGGGAKSRAELTPTPALAARRLGCGARGGQEGRQGRQPVAPGTARPGLLDEEE